MSGLAGKIGLLVHAGPDKSPGMCGKADMARVDNTYSYALTALSIATKATPISANTASHMEATPHVPRKIKIILIPSAKDIFCQTIILVFLATAMAVTTCMGESAISTMSAV